MDSLPKTQTAIIANEHGNLVISHDVALAPLRPDTVLIRSECVALNPVDAKLTGPMGFHGAISGSDVSGVVVGLGPDVPTGRNFQIGDRVCAAVQSMNPLAPLTGAYAEYVDATADFTLKLPTGMGWEEAATLGIGTATIGYALFWSLKVPGHPQKPAEQPCFVLVYGGSTASGTMAIQIVRRSGLVPITTCSPHNFALVEQYGAEKAWDYKDARAVDQIREYTKNRLKYVLDCFCEGNSMSFCYDCIGRPGGFYTSLEPYNQVKAASRKLIKADWLLGPALFGKKLGWPPPYDVEPDPALREFGREWYLCVQALLDQGLLKTHPVKMVEGGFKGVLDGLELLRNKAVSGAKLVVHVRGGQVVEKKLKLER
ncbi:uncharacterized protein PpBr36_10636 [Pyricularia pennisetigena]|uniref:uncharacterized protein n=1 Tax=Pyricularia pennisetigena TaxID=1578925 RepID=UPI0011524F6E|nr:uncharacterized protein PpBr36_10636 [Pyricularia pennisetigena]TLS21202.1 hypothetical protein PpBr36_10636 [Pyricularia pennisetigena]